MGRKAVPNPDRNVGPGPRHHHWGHSGAPHSPGDPGHPDSPGRMGFCFPFSPQSETPGTQAWGCCTGGPHPGPAAIWAGPLSVLGAVLCAVPGLHSLDSKSTLLPVSRQPQPLGGLMSPGGRQNHYGQDAPLHITGLWPVEGGWEDPGLPP